LLDSFTFSVSDETEKEQSACGGKNNTLFVIGCTLDTFAASKGRPSLEEGLCFMPFTKGIKYPDYPACPVGGNHRTGVNPVLLMLVDVDA